MPDVSVVVAAGEVPISDRLTELEALASGEMDMAALLSATPMRTRLPQPGARIKGVITAVHHDELHVDLGLRTSGVLLRRERPNAAIGDEVEAYVVEADDNGIQLSARLSGQAAAAHLDDAKDAGIPVEGLVASRNGGGYEVKLGGVRAFCPTSHISRIPLLDPDSVIGTTIPFLILETGEKIVVSHRALAEREMEGAREAFWASAREGDKRLGVVTSVSAWAAWVDLDGVEAKLPRKEFGWEEIEDLSARLVRGQRLDVRLHELDAAQGRITVSTRDPSLDPWLSIDEKLRIGEVRTGRVMGQADYGAFVEVLPGLQGLMHVSRLGGEPLPTPGAAVEVRVLSFDARSRRIELAPPAFEPSSAAATGAHKPGAASQQGVEVEATVVEVEPRGVRVRLADGRQGWLPANEIQLAPNQTLNHRFRAGYTLKARIKSEGPGDRVTLSQRDDDGSEGAWRGQLASAPRASMGTLGDLLRGARR